MGVFLLKYFIYNFVVSNIKILVFIFVKPDVLKTYIFSLFEIE